MHYYTSILVVNNSANKTCSLKLFMNEGGSFQEHVNMHWYFCIIPLALVWSKAQTTGCVLGTH